MTTNHLSGKEGCSASEGSSSRWAAPGCAFWGKTLPVAGCLGADGQGRVSPRLPKTRGHRAGLCPVAGSTGSELPKAGAEMSGRAWCMVILRNLKGFLSKRGKKKSISSSSVLGNNLLVSVLASERKIHPIRLQPS